MMAGPCSMYQNCDSAEGSAFQRGLGTGAFRSGLSIHRKGPSDGSGYAAGDLGEVGAGIPDQSAVDAPTLEMRAESLHDLSGFL